MPSNVRPIRGQRGDKQSIVFPPNATFADRLRAYIDICGAENDSDFARRAGLHRDRISKFVNGKQDPSTGSLSALMQAFKWYGMPLAFEELVPDPTILVSGGLVEAAEGEMSMAGRRSRRDQDQHTPLSSRSFDFQGKVAHVRINETLPVALANQILQMLLEADAAAEAAAAAEAPHGDAPA